MTALANYSKYTGRYDQFQQIRQRYSLKWSKGDSSMQAFQRFFNEELTLDSMLQRIKEMCSKLPIQMSRIVKYGVLVGLRPSEVVESVKLINNNQTFEKYYNPNNKTLEHFRFPDVFLRQTKKAFLSFVSPEILEIAKLPFGIPRAIPSYNDIRYACWRIGLKMDMRYCRKIFASWLHKYGISTEIVDFLQGRVSTSVFSRHYLTPDSSLKDRVLRALHELEKSL